MMRKFLLNMNCHKLKPEILILSAFNIEITVFSEFNNLAEIRFNSTVPVKIDVFILEYLSAIVEGNLVLITSITSLLNLY